LRPFIKCQYFNDGRQIFTKIGTFIENIDRDIDAVKLKVRKAC